MIPMKQLLRGDVTINANCPKILPHFLLNFCNTNPSLRSNMNLRPWPVESSVIVPRPQININYLLKK